MRYNDIKNILAEEKQVGILYHYTYIENLVAITDTQTLRPMDYDGISFTRNKHLHRTADGSIGEEARFVIDGNKLSRKYKVRPFNYFNDNRIPGENDSKYFHNPDTDEAEELVKEPIRELSRYVLKLEIEEESLRAIYHGKYAFHMITNPKEWKERFPDEHALLKFFKMFYHTNVVRFT
jgi:hypothetical protein